MDKKTFCENNNISEAQFSGEEKISGYLDLRSLTSIPEGFNPTVGGYLVLKNSREHIGSPILQMEALQINKSLFWNKNGKRYATIDGIFCELLSEKAHARNGEEYHILSAKKVNKDEFFFIANKGAFYAHGEDLKTAFEDLEFKIVAEKLKKEPIGKDTLITVQYYRIITGASKLGCKKWMEQNNITKEEIRAEELLTLLEKTSAYGVDRFKKLMVF